MVKFGKNKLRALNKLAKKQNTAANSVTASNKILKKKHNVVKKATFQKEVLLKETLAEGSPLVKSVTAQEIILNELTKKPAKRKEKMETEEVKKPKSKPVETKKKRQQTLKNDTKLLLKLMSKK